MHHGDAQNGELLSFSGKGATGSQAEMLLWRTVSFNRIVKLMHWWHSSHNLFLLMYVSCCLDLPTVLSSWEIVERAVGRGWVVGNLGEGH